jgi:hypothetical protein
VLWVLTVTILAMLLFKEGISYAETGRATSQQLMTTPPDTLFIFTGRKAEELNSLKEFSVPDDEYSVLIDESQHKLYIGSELRFYPSEDNQAKIEIRKQSSGRTRAEAARKAESLEYNYTLHNDTLRLDEYFTLPAGSRWSADNLKVNLYIPENTVIYFDNGCADLMHRGRSIPYTDSDGETWSTHDYNEEWHLGNRYWKLKDEGLIEVQKVTPKK